MTIKFSSEGIWLVHLGSFFLRWLYCGQRHWCFSSFQFIAALRLSSSWVVFEHLHISSHWRVKVWVLFQTLVKCWHIQISCTYVNCLNWFSWTLLLFRNDSETYSSACMYTFVLQPIRESLNCFLKSLSIQQQQSFTLEKNNLKKSFKFKSYHDFYVHVCKLQTTLRWLESYSYILLCKNGQNFIRRGLIYTPTFCKFKHI